MDRQQEERELQLADVHIGEARARIAEQEARIASGRLFPGEITLAHFEEHRAHIAQVIEDIDQGRR